MTARSEDASSAVVQFLWSNWDKNNTSIDFKPAIHDGEYHRTKPEDPQVIVESTSEESINDGQLPFAGIAKDGKPPQHWRVDIEILALVDKNDSSPFTDSEKLKDLVEEFSEEVKRLFRDNHGGTSYFDQMGFVSKSKDIRTRLEPTQYGHSIVCMAVYWDS